MSENRRCRLRRCPRDFTGGGIFGLPRKFESTGDESIDNRISELVNDWGCGNSAPLIHELITTALLMGRDAMSDGDLKLYNRALKEMRSSSQVFGPYEDERKIAIFGSARTNPDEKEFFAAKEFAKKMQEVGFMSITGAGPGIMEAAQAGSGRDYSFGLNIKLPFEQGANSTIHGDEKLIDYNYFFTRKLAFVKESDAMAAFPGGFGTMDEIFETLTLMQTGKASVFPILLIDAPGGTYWKTWLQFVKDHLFRLGLISEEDFYLFKVTDDLEEAVNEIQTFYKVFHSYRYVKGKLVMRLLKQPGDDLLKNLNSDFCDLIKGGTKIVAGEALKEESDEPHLAQMPRLIFTPNRGKAGRVRQMIDLVNTIA